MLEHVDTFLENLAGWVWGLPMVVLLIGSGLLFTILLRGIQFRAFGHALEVVRGKFDNKDDPGEISHFKALTTALSATIGLGNIAGVAIAISTGGPGAVFWMTLAGFVGMATKYCECSLSLLYRKVGHDGRVLLGGPMQYIAQGLGEKFRPLAIFFAVSCIISSFGISNMFQSNQTAMILNNFFSVTPWLTGSLLAVAVGLVIVGGLQRIAKTTSFLVPFMGGIYVLGASIVILTHVHRIPELLSLILRDAFTGQALAGGSLGAVIIAGVRRACFSNEAGIGSAAIAHCAAATKEPVREGVVALLGPFIDTVIICNMTALVILISGNQFGEAQGIELTALAFDSAIPGFGNYFVPFAALLFSFSTMISWSYYGEMSAKFLTDKKSCILYYKIIFCLFVLMGAVWSPASVINFSDMALGLMVVPNLIGVWLLFPKLKTADDSYFRRMKGLP